MLFVDDFEVDVEVEGAWSQLDDVARGRLNQIAEEFALGVRARFHGVNRGGRGRRRLGRPLCGRRAVRGILATGRRERREPDRNAHRNHGSG